LILVGIIGMIIANYGISQNIPSYIPKNGLTGWWPFNGNANDESGNGNNGTVNGADLTSDKNGKINSAYSFNGSSDYISLTKPFFNGATSISSFTYFVDFKINKLPSSGTSYSLSTKEGYWRSIGIYVTDKGTITFQGSQPEGYFQVKSLSSIEIDKWYSVFVIFDKSKLTLYINGELIASENLIWSTFDFSWVKEGNSTSTNYIGAAHPVDPGINCYFNGVIDNFGIWNRSLNSNEIIKISTPCIKQNATTSSFDKIILKNQSSIQLIGQPTGGNFLGTGITNNIFNPTKSKLGKNYVDYVFKNDSGCDDTTRFNFTVYDTLGLTCTKTDTVKVTKTIYDTIITKTTVEDTLKIKVGITTGIYANQINTIKMFPNPTASDLVIDFGNQEMIKGYTLMITDILGKEVYKSIIVSKSTTIKLSSLGGKGIYRVNIIDENQKVFNVKQIVLE
jgi:hypothetical protein